MKAKEEASKMMNQILRESRHNDNFHEDNWDTTGVQIRRPNYEENDCFEISEEYLNMSPEELKQAKEEEYERIQAKLEERFRTAMNNLEIIKVSSTEVAKGIFRSGEHRPFAEPTIEFFFENIRRQCEDYLEDLVEPIVPSDTVSSLKKRIKHCKNPMEKKNLEQQLNSLYKERKRRHDQCGKSL